LGSSLEICSFVSLVIGSGLSFFYDLNEIPPFFRDPLRREINDGDR